MMKPLKPQKFLILFSQNLNFYILIIFSYIYSPIALYFSFTALLMFFSGNTAFGNIVLLGLGSIVWQVTLKASGYTIPRETPQFFSKLNINFPAIIYLETILH